MSYWKFCYFVLRNTLYYPLDPYTSNGTFKGSSYILHIFLKCTAILHNNTTKQVPVCR